MSFHSHRARWPCCRSCMGQHTGQSLAVWVTRTRWAWWWELIGPEGWRLWRPPWSSYWCPRLSGRRPGRRSRAPQRTAPTRSDATSPPSGPLVTQKQDFRKRLIHIVPISNFQIEDTLPFIFVLFSCKISCRSEVKVGNTRWHQMLCMVIHLDRTWKVTTWEELQLGIQMCG